MVAGVSDAMAIRLPVGPKLPTEALQTERQSSVPPAVRASRWARLLGYALKLSVMSDHDTTHVLRCTERRRRARGTEQVPRSDSGTTIGRRDGERGNLELTDFLRGKAQKRTVCAQVG